jgi:hypothetical protein
METGILNAIKLTHHNKESFRDQYDDYNLSSVIESLKTEIPLHNGKLITKVLLKSPGKNIVLIKMNEGTEIISFQKNQSVTFRILQGKIRLHIRKGSLTLNEGESLILSEKTKYRIASMESAAFLMTLAS